MFDLTSRTKRPHFPRKIPVLPSQASISADTASFCWATNHINQYARHLPMLVDRGAASSKVMIGSTAIGIGRALMRGAERTSDATSGVNGWSSVNIWWSGRLTSRRPVELRARLRYPLAGPARANGDARSPNSPYVHKPRSLFVSSRPQAVAQFPPSTSVTFFRKHPISDHPFSHAISLSSNQTSRLVVQFPARNCEPFKVRRGPRVPAFATECRLRSLSYVLKSPSLMFPVKAKAGGSAAWRERANSQIG